MTARMDRDSREAATADIVRVRGRFDAAASAEIRRDLVSRIDAGRVRLVVDLGDVDFIDSSGLSVLVMALKRCRQAGGAVALLAPRPEVQAVLDLTRLAQVFGVFAEEAEAVAAVANDAG